jgi:hypothetical protein
MKSREAGLLIGCLDDLDLLLSKIIQLIDKLIDLLICRIDLSLDDGLFLFGFPPTPTLLVRMFNSMCQAYPIHLPKSTEVRKVCH